MKPTAADPSSRVPPIAWTLCGLLFLATALSFLDRQVLSVLASPLTKDLGMNNTDYSDVVSAFMVAYTLMFAAGGWLVDRLGTVRGLALAVAVWSLASAGHALAAGALGLAVARFVLGMGEGACFPGATRGVCEWFPPEKRGLALGIAIGGAAFGSVVAPPLTVSLAGRYGWRGAFLATGVLGAAWVLAWLVAGMFAPTTRAADRSGAGSDQPTLVHVLGQPTVWPILLARFCFDPVFYFYMFWIPKYLAEARDFSLDEIGKYYWIPFLALGVSNIASGQWADFLLRRGWSPQRTRFTLLALAAFVTPVSCAVIFTPSAGWAIGLMAVLMAAHGLWICNYIALINDHFPARVMGTIVGLSGTVGGTAGIIATKVTGPIVDSQGFAPIFVGTSFLYPLAFVVLLAIPRTMASRQEFP